MSKRFVKQLGLVLTVAALAVAGCSSERSPLAPPPVESRGIQPTAQPSNGLLGGLLGGVLGAVGKLVNIVVSVLERPVALQQDVVWSFYAGPGGATSGNRTVGLSIVVPPGALDRQVKITVTARKGKVIDYHFEPEGLQFAKPVVLTQEIPSQGLLGGLLSGNRTLRGAYYAAPTLSYDPKTGTATVNELQPSVTVPGYISFQIRHFSGYVVASCDNESSFSWFQ